MSAEPLGLATDQPQRLAVEVLLREYVTLRAEILARVRSRFELLGFLALVATIAGIRNVSLGFRAGSESCRS